MSRTVKVFTLSGRSSRSFSSSRSTAPLNPFSAPTVLFAETCVRPPAVAYPNTTTSTGWGRDGMASGDGMTPLSTTPRTRSAAKLSHFSLFPVAVVQSRMMFLPEDGEMPSGGPEPVFSSSIFTLYLLSPPRKTNASAPSHCSSSIARAPTEPMSNPTYRRCACFPSAQAAARARSSCRRTSSKNDLSSGDHLSEEGGGATADGRCVAVVPRKLRAALGESQETGWRPRPAVGGCTKSTPAPSRKATSARSTTAARFRFGHGRAGSEDAASAIGTAAATSCMSFVYCLINRLADHVRSNVCE
mmetsp:Transcript_1352/g.3100  ORF Transcript_1352/g.3100 Transcript_1352/m.3100 type:complete len:302 (+) Transcript_1352:238-1143(+)